MKKVWLYFGIVVIMMAFPSCKGKKGVFSPSSTGSAYEIMVIIDGDLWERPAGQAIKEVLNSEVPGLPQPEATFRVMHADPAHFSTTLKLIRNIIMFDIRDIYTQTKLGVTNDVFAQPQAVMTIQSPDEKGLADFIIENREVIINYFSRAEMNRQMAILENRHSNYISTKVAEMFDCDIWIPGELSSSKIGENFFWASSDGAVELSFLMYSYPYTDNDTFTKAYFLAKRDSVVKVNIPGVKEGIYMATDTMSVRVKPISVQGEYAFEARGLWKMKGDFMGGPFVSHSRVDGVNHRVITAEVFVYAPQKNKRNDIRMLEASLYTLRLPQDRLQKTKADIDSQKPVTE